MGWSVGFDSKWGRDIGYGVPATCDHPVCETKIDRGLAYVCGGQPFGGEEGCGLYFCGAHQWFKDVGNGERVFVCERCLEDKPPFDPTPDVAEWINHKATDPSWAQWRAERCQHRSVTWFGIPAQGKCDECGTVGKDGLRPAVV